MSRTVFITGVGRGLGRELAARLIDSGDSVYGSTNQSPCDLGLAGLVTMDLGDEQNIQSAATELATLTGGGPGTDD